MSVTDKTLEFSGMSFCFIFTRVRGGNSSPIAPVSVPRTFPLGLQRRSLRSGEGSWGVGGNSHRSRGSERCISSVRVLLLGGVGFGNQNPKELTQPDGTYRPLESLIFLSSLYRLIQTILFLKKRIVVIKYT